MWIYAGDLLDSNSCRPDQENPTIFRNLTPARNPLITGSLGVRKTRSSPRILFSLNFFAFSGFEYMDVRMAVCEESLAILYGAVDGASEIVEGISSRQPSGARVVEIL